MFRLFDAFGDDAEAEAEGVGGGEDGVDDGGGGANSKRGREIRGFVTPLLESTKE